MAGAFGNASAVARPRILSAISAQLQPSSTSSRILDRTIPQYLPFLDAYETSLAGLDHRRQDSFNFLTQLYSRSHSHLHTTTVIIEEAEELRDVFEAVQERLEMRRVDRSHDIGLVRED